MIMGNFGIGELILILFMVVFFSLIYVIPAWRILKKAGYNPAWSLLVMVPLANIIGLYVFAFTRWPIEDHSAKAS